MRQSITVTFQRDADHHRPSSTRAAAHRHSFKNVGHSRLLYVSVYSSTLLEQSSTCAYMRSHLCAYMRSHLFAYMRSHLFAYMCSHLCAYMRSHLCAHMRSHLFAYMRSHLRPSPLHGSLHVTSYVCPYRYVTSYVCQLGAVPASCQRGFLAAILGHMLLHMCPHITAVCACVLTLTILTFLVCVCVCVCVRTLSYRSRTPIEQQ